MNSESTTEQITRIKFDLSPVRFKQTIPNVKINVLIKKLFFLKWVNNTEKTQKIDRQDLARKLPEIGSPYGQVNLGLGSR